MSLTYPNPPVHPVRTKTSREAEPHSIFLLFDYGALLLLLRSKGRWAIGFLTFPQMEDALLLVGVYRKGFNYRYKEGRDRLCVIHPLRRDRLCVFMEIHKDATAGAVQRAWDSASESIPVRIRKR
jgi:hypothetical protein